MPSDEADETGPRPRSAAVLAAPAQGVEPQFLQLIHELPQALLIARDGMVIQPALYNPAQPAAGLVDGSVPASTQPFLKRCQGPAHPFPVADAFDDEPPVAVSRRAEVGEAQKVEGLRLSASPLSSSVGGVATELDQSCFLVMQLQSEPGEPLPESR
jgi:hypothetical protein